MTWEDELEEGYGQAEHHDWMVIAYFVGVGLIAAAGVVVLVWDTIGRLGR